MSPFIEREDIHRKAKRQTEVDMPVKEVQLYATRNHTMHDDQNIFHC